MAFRRPTMLAVLLAQREEQDRQARQSVPKASREAVQEVKARRDLGYPPRWLPLEIEKETDAHD